MGISTPPGSMTEAEIEKLYASVRQRNEEAHRLREQIANSDIGSYRFVARKKGYDAQYLAGSATFDEAGTFVGSSYVYATAQDFARFGWLYLNDGMWNGTRILPEGWVDHGRTWVATDPENNTGYGAHWWLPPAVPGSMAAFGYEGQFTFVVPDRDLVVVRLGKSPVPMGQCARETVEELIGEFPISGPRADKSGPDV